ncbi:HD-GYP domain-containing protein [Halioxenophilus aromaticivorans]|uniref:HD-GYP domain-containing protein n=1 Tax=Halioxenophilus aromaticivorans TaxID=1306992 RepID=UPI0031E7D90F
MGVKQVKVDVNELLVGMFVSGLDRPWSQTPFPLQGFYVRDLEEIRELKAHCRHVYIDMVKGKGPVETNLKTLAPRNGGVKQPLSRAGKSDRSKIDVGPLKIRRNAYGPVEQPLGSEINNAKQLHSRVYHAVTEVVSQIGNGDSVPISETKRYASDMVDSVLRNPDAFTWLTRVKEVDEHTYAHAVRSAVWAIVFGRHIGLSMNDLNTLAMGVLLKDVGKTRVNKKLLSRADLNQDELKEFEKFIDHGVEILRTTPNVEPRMISVVKTHCERINGSGFPQHLRGDKIPLLGKIAGIVTYYDSVVNARGQAQPLAPSKAVAKLYEMRDIEFQEELVVEFIRAIGLYPTGTLVELSNGEIAVVVEQNFARRLKPKVMVVMDALRERLDNPRLLDLAELEERHKKMVESSRTLVDVEVVEIARDLEPGKFDIDIAQIRDQYLFRQVGKTKKSLFSFLKRQK